MTQRKIETNRILTDDEVKLLSAGLREMLGPGLDEGASHPAVRLERTVRYRAVSAQCKAARGNLGLSIKETSVRLRTPQYRLKAVEDGSFTEILPNVFTSYIAFLGLSGWLRRWIAANRPFASELGIEQADNDASYLSYAKAERRFAELSVEQPASGGIPNHKMGPAMDKSASSNPTVKRKDIVVFLILRDSVCADCGKDLPRGSFLRMEGDRPMCTACADLDHLVFLPRGDAALTRRAAKHSRLSPVVVRFSRSRNRYERQGLLVQEEALERAERECLDDADAREAARARAAGRRMQRDEEYIRAFALAVEEQFPLCPEKTRERISEHACLKHSGRVGRSAAAKRFDPHAIELAVRAHVRHEHTPYDELLGQGGDREEARLLVVSAVDQVITGWRKRSGRYGDDAN